MTSDNARHVPDTQWHVPGTGHGDTRTLAMCGHKARNGKRIGGVLVRCVECQAARKGQQ